MSSARTDGETFCTFRVADMLFGLEVCQVQEVIRVQRTTRVPLAPLGVHGLMNLRGQIVTTLDFRHRLGLEPLEADRQPMNVVVRSKNGPVSLLVDQVGDVVQVEQSCFEAPPETLQEEQRELIRGAFKLKNELLLILATTHVTDIAA